MNSKKRITEGKTARLYDWWEINQVKMLVPKNSTSLSDAVESNGKYYGILPDDYFIIDPFLEAEFNGFSLSKIQP